MDARWRPLQIEHGRRAREAPAGGGRSSALGSGAGVGHMFYEIASILDGCAETGGCPRRKTARGARHCRAAPSAPA